MFVSLAPDCQGNLYNNILITSYHPVQWPWPLTVHIIFIDALTDKIHVDPHGIKVMYTEFR